MQAQENSGQGVSRREMLKCSGAAVGGALLASALAGQVHAAEDNTIKVALVGCGGRGTGAAFNALSTKGPTRLVAMADVFPDRMNGSYQSLAQRFGKQVDVPQERRFIGFDAYQKAVNEVGSGGLIILATPPAFRPIHLEYAVEKGVNVFMEKSFAVDAPGIRRVMKAGEAAKAKNLKIAGGLMCRHNVPLEQAIEQIHKGAIGEVITCWAYREHGPVGFAPRSQGENEIAHQIRNYSSFTWLNGSFLLDWLIHNIDVCCWVKDAWPVSAQAQGGRQVRTAKDQLFDHYSCEYTFPDGTRLMAQGRHIDGCWNFFGSQILGASGCAVLGEGIDRPRLYKGHKPLRDKQIWEYQGPDANPYQYEHDLLFEAIRQDKPYNETDRCAKAAMTGILGRMASESGKMVTWDEAMASNFELAPGLDKITWDSKAPVEADAQGNYPVAKPGTTKNY